MARAPLCLALLGLTGCFSPGNPVQRLTESAYDMNTATRFGRMDVALEHVGANAREAWTKRHAAWGKSLRVVDLEFGGLNLKNKGTEAEVVVTVVWHKVDESDVRVTSVAQRWEDVRGTWSLVAEEEKDGDGGLLALPHKAAEEPAAAPSRYRTRILQGAEE